MQRHSYSIEVEATVDELWEVFWYREPDRPQAKIGSIEILHPGDADGNGLVRHCTFQVPKFLGSGGIGKSWEWLTEVVPKESWRYDAIGTPPWSRAVGHQRLEPLGPDRVRLHFEETYETFNPWLRRVGLERYVHDRISKDNDSILAAIQGGVYWHRKRRARAAAAAETPHGNGDSTTP